MSTSSLERGTAMNFNFTTTQQDRMIQQQLRHMEMVQQVCIAEGITLGDLQRMAADLNRTNNIYAAECMHSAGVSMTDTHAVLMTAPKEVNMVIYGGRMPGEFSSAVALRRRKATLTEWLAANGYERLLDKVDAILKA